MLPPTHILLYTDDAQWGGVAQYNHALLCALAQRGDQVTGVQAFADNALKRREAELGVRHQWLTYDPSFNVERMLTQGEDAQRIFAQLRPDLVVFSNGMPVSHLAARRVAIKMGIPYLTVEGLAASYLADMFAPHLAEVGQHYEKARAVIAVSQDNLHCLRQRFGLPAKKGQVIHYGRPERFFAPPDLAVRSRLRGELAIPDDAVLCFSAGRLHPMKGYQYQLQAIDRLRHTPIWPKLHFAWAGIGQLLEPLRNALGQLGVDKQVTLLGQRDDVADWLDAADIFVLPSEAEGMPLAVMEAMAKGVPVTASAVNGIPEELGATGQLLPDPTINPQGTISLLADTLQIWAQNDDLRRQVGEAGRSRAREMFREGRMIAETLRVIDAALLPEGDYVSPGLAVVKPDRCFPHMRLGDKRAQGWPYFRREVPHNWYVDQRWPSIGFVSRDEAHILYNSALQFKGRRALEIGCFFGWSACHLALAGVDLDVIDPLLAEPAIHQSVSASLQAAGVQSKVRLHAGASPGLVHTLNDKHPQPWSFIFIDGDHEGHGPLIDAQACAQVAAPDALVLFHDLASPHVARGLEYFREQGWHTKIYHTMQLMGVAWRGNVRPVEHRADSAIAWETPKHLSDYK